MVCRNCRRVRLTMSLIHPTICADCEHELERHNDRVHTDDHSATLAELASRAMYNHWVARRWRRAWECW